MSTTRLYRSYLKTVRSLPCPAYVKRKMTDNVAIGFRAPLSDMDTLPDALHRGNYHLETLQFLATLPESDFALISRKTDFASNSD